MGNFCGSQSQPTGSGRSGSSKRLLEEYSVGPTLGEGTFGVVYLCTHRLTGEEVAVKMVDKVETPVENIKKEAELLKSMKHTNIVKFHGVFFERCFVCIVMDKYNGGDLVSGLQQHMKQRGKVNCQEVVHIFSQTASSLQYLHRRCIVHRDIKGDNFLLDRRYIADPKCRVVLADFGASCHLRPKERLSEEVGTKIFWAPEVFERNYSFKVDIWALGIVMYGLLACKFPFKDESDVMRKEPRNLKRIHPDCQDCLQRMLLKDEERRPSADTLASHVWITGKARQQRDDDQVVQQASEAEHVDVGGLRPEGVSDGVARRRRELMERLNNEHSGQRARDKRAGDGKAHFLAKWFTIFDKNSGCTMKYEWWNKEQVESSGAASFQGTALLNLEDTERSPQLVAQMLTDHNIDITQFGQGEAKPLVQLAAEVQSGDSRLMLDATMHKKLVRVVDVVLLRLHGTADDARILVETSEQFPDGRKRSIFRLPGTKRRPHENLREAAGRILEEQLHMDECAVRFEFEDREVFEEEGISPSFPGVRTVYRKEIVQCHVISEDKALLQRVGLPGGSAWSPEESSNNNRRYYEWMSQRQAEVHKVKLKADTSEEVSGLVIAPIGLNEEDLGKYLTANRVEVAKFGANHAKTLREFSSELMKGESSLMEDNNGKVIRVVDLVLLKMIDCTNGHTLLQTEQTFPDKTKKTLNRLPAGKRRPDESQFVTARRVLRRQLKIDENQVKFDQKNCQYFQEDSTSPGFPGIRTVYRKRLLTVELVRAKVVD